MIYGLASAWRVYGDGYNVTSFSTTRGISNRGEGMEQRSKSIIDKGLWCPVCLASDVGTDPYYYWWQEKKWSIMRCRICTHQFVYPFLTTREQEMIYSDRYFSKEGDWVCNVWDSGYVESEEMLRSEAAVVLDMLPISGGSLLEIGCAGGYFLDEARKRGFDVMGIEPNHSMVRHACERLGVSVIEGRIEDIEENAFNESFSTIVLMDVLEHIPVPHSVIRKIKRWLAPNGWLLIRGPLANDPIGKVKEALRRLTGTEKQLSGYPLDVNVFNKESQAFLVEQFQINVSRWIDVKSNFANLLAFKVS